MVGHITVAARSDARKGVTGRRNATRNRRDRLFDIAGLVEITRTADDQRLQVIAIDAGTVDWTFTLPILYCSPSSNVMVMVYSFVFSFS